MTAAATGRSRPPDTSDGLADVAGDRRHTEHGRERKQQLVDAAAELFAANGYAATRIQDICERAGVAKGLFYWYFPTKQELFAELVRTMRLRLRKAQAQAMDAGADPLTRIRQGAEASVRFHAEHAGYFALLDVERADATHAELLREGSAVYLADVVTLVRAAQADGLVTDEPAEALAVGVLGAVSSFTHAWRDRRIAMDAETLATFVGAWVERALKSYSAIPSLSFVRVSRRQRSRHLEASAVSAIGPALVIAPFCLLALLVLWLLVRLVWDVPYWWFAGGYGAAVVLLFIRPVQAFVLTPLFGARRPTDAEQARIWPIWQDIAGANRMPPDRYILRVLPSDEINAYACGGHLVVVTTFAIEELPRRELAGVLAHELSHHLGLHTVALTVGHWLSLPVVLLARVGFWLQNVATAATDTFARGSSALTIFGQLVAGVLNVLSLPFVGALYLADALGNVVSHRSEFQADRRVVRMGYGRNLSHALRRMISMGGGHRPVGWRARLGTSHPPARTRVARIDAMLRHPAR